MQYFCYNLHLSQKISIFQQTIFLHTTRKYFSVNQKAFAKCCSHFANA
nr:MAG TPA: hypothetical protein [Caudoviricetes sp.]